MLAQALFRASTGNILEHARGRRGRLRPNSTFYIFDAVSLSDLSLYIYSRAYLAPNGTYISTGSMPSLTWKGIKDAFSLIFEAVGWRTRPVQVCRPFF